MITQVKGREDGSRKNMTRAEVGHGPLKPLLLSMTSVEPRLKPAINRNHQPVHHIRRFQQPVARTDLVVMVMGTRLDGLEDAQRVGCGR
jgi:hypothetical protein